MDRRHERKPTETALWKTDLQGLHMLEFSDIQFQVSILTLVRVVKDKMEKFGRCGCYKVKDQLGNLEQMV